LVLPSTGNNNCAAGKRYLQLSSAALTQACWRLFAAFCGLSGYLDSIDIYKQMYIRQFHLSEAMIPFIFFCIVYRFCG